VTEEGVQLASLIDEYPKSSAELRRWTRSDPELVISGEAVVPARTKEVVDPSTGLSLCEAPVATPDEVDQAFASAREAQRGWQALGPFGRYEVIRRAADVVQQRAHDFAILDAVDSGNPLSAMYTDVLFGVQHLRYFSALGLSIRGDTYAAAGGGLHYSLREPYGVVARIVPFNHPAMFAIGKLAQPLIAGNTVLLKPAEQTPLSALYLSALLRDVLPPGVVTVLSGDAGTGAALVRHPDIKRIAFMGGVLTGQRVQADAAAVGVKAVSLELGGKNPMLVFPDADLSRAVAGCVAGMNLTVCQGQSCGSNSRLLVHESIFDRFVEALTVALRSINVGVAYEAGTEMGPLVDHRQYERVTAFIERGRDEARLLAGGGRPAGVPGGGYYVEPTLFEVQGTEEIAANEIFGPVISAMRWSDEEEVIEAANRLPYGLTASVWSRDISRVNRIVRELAAGYVWVNEHGAHYLGSPFGGYKASGVGEEESLSEIESFLQTKSVHVADV
jgi:betaine-aldehyde dehydrogenase